MKYPNGKSFTPNSIKSSVPITYGNRGMDLEQEINLSNEYYLEEDIAAIYKKPTPIKITEVDYKSKGKVITKAFFENPSTTDYNGIYKGKYIDFEAKETKLKTSFPLKNIHPHQIEHMMRVVKHGGICFLIVRFHVLNRKHSKFSGKPIQHDISCNYLPNYSPSSWLLYGCNIIQNDTQSNFSDRFDNSR